MSWENKQDYCGLAVANKVLVKTATLNRTGSYLEKTGASGAIVATKAFGVRAAPSNEYVIQAANSYAAGAIKIGAVTTVDTKRYALASLHYENGAGTEPVFSATAQQIEDTTDGTTRTFDVPAFSISPDEIAVMIASAGTLGGEGCELSKVVFDASANIKPHEKNGVIVASDVVNGHATVQITVLQTGATEPTLTAGTGWDISSPLTSTDPDSDMPTWTATLSIPLTYTVAPAA